MTETVIRIPTLRTERLVLRAPSTADFEAYAAFRGGARARTLGGPFTRIRAFEQFTAIAGHWQLRGYGRWIVADAASDEALGVVGPFFPEGWPEPEIAWSLFDDAEGRGIAFEAASAARDHAYRHLGWTGAISLIDAANTRSIALAKRLGARLDGEYRHPELGTLGVYRHPGREAA